MYDNYQWLSIIVTVYYFTSIESKSIIVINKKTDQIILKDYGI